MGSLGQPHHDGSSMYVSNPYPALGEEVTLLVRVPHTYPIKSLHVRWIWDGEPRFTEGVLDASGRHEDWWRVNIVIRNLVTNYRFALGRLDGGGDWLNGMGLVGYDPLDWCDFSLIAEANAPAWTEGAVFYQIFLDRFARGEENKVWPDWADPAAWADSVVSGSPDAMSQAYGGDLVGIAQRLDYIEELGANAIYLTPFFPAPSNHRYNASTFDTVDPLLGGDAALADLSARVHARGMRLIGDITPNHCGDTHEWFRAAVADPRSVESSFFFFDPDTGGYETWMGVPTLPKLDVRTSELRKRLYEGADSVIARWMQPPYNLDGWRVDVANMVGRSRRIDENHEVSRAIRRTVSDTNQDGYLVAEHAHDASRDLVSHGWHGVMNYTGFTLPVWRWLGSGDPDVDYLGYPLDLYRLAGNQVALMMDETRAANSWGTTTQSLNLLGSHDTARIRSVVPDAPTQLVAAALLMTSPGTPMVFAGDEVGLAGKTAEAGRQPMPWDSNRWDRPTLDGYRGLIHLRRSYTALSTGGLRWVDQQEGSLTFLREDVDHRFLVQLNRGPTEPLHIGAGTLDAGALVDAQSGTQLIPEGGSFVLPSEGPGAWVWEIHPDRTG